MDINSSELLNTVIKLFIIMVIGFGAYKLKFMDRDFSKKLSNFVICVGTPFLVLGGLLGTNDKSFENLKSGLIIILVGICIYIFTASVAFISTRPIKDSAERCIGEFALLFANTGFMGFPVLKALFGDEKGAFYGSFYIIAFNLVIWTYGIFVISKSGSGVKIKPINMILNYGTVPCILGIILYMLPWQLPAVVTDAFKMVGDITIPCSMFIIGGVIATIPFGKIFSDLKVYVLLLIKLFAIPIAASGIVRLLGLDNFYIYFVAIMTALPCASNTVMYAEKYDVAPEFGAKLTGISTVLSVVTVPVVLSIVDKLFISTAIC